MSGGGANAGRRFAFGAQAPRDGSDASFLSDWQLLKNLNDMPWRRQTMRDAQPLPLEERSSLQSWLNKVTGEAEAKAADFDHEFELPRVEVLAVFWPSP